MTVPDHSKVLFLILGEFAWSFISTEKGTNILMKEEKMLLEKACAHNTGMGLQGRQNIFLMSVTIFILENMSFLGPEIFRPFSSFTPQFKRY